jgi:uncharacterized protein (TIGR04222 family)
MAAGHAVTPSDAVDQAWHLHLTYSQSYWEEFCPTLGKPLHHHPGEGGDAEADKFRAQYQKTLASYEIFFGEKPPADIWPEAGIRFGEDLHYARVNQKRYWLIAKGFGWQQFVFRWLELANAVREKYSRHRRRSWRMLFLALLAMPLLISSCAGGMNLSLLNPLNYTPSEFVVFYAIGGVIILWIAIAWQDSLRLPNAPAQPYHLDFDVYELAYIIRGYDSILEVCLLRLLQANAITMDPSTYYFYLSEQPKADLSALEQAVFRAVAGSGIFSYMKKSPLLKEPIEPIQDRLKQHGLLVNEQQMRKMQNYPALILFEWLCLGLIKLFSEWRHEAVSEAGPVGMLLLLCMGAFLITFHFWIASREKISHYGDQAISHFKSHFADLKNHCEESQLPLALAVFGPAVLAGSAFTDFQKLIAPPPRPVPATKRRDDSGGCGGGDCGGGGCGG